MVHYCHNNDNLKSLQAFQKFSTLVVTWMQVQMSWYGRTDGRTGGGVEPQFCEPFQLNCRVMTLMIIE